MTLSTRIGVMNHGEIVQVGTPSEIYEYPNSRFVTEFIGSVNMFEGRLIEDEPAYVRIQCDDFEAPIFVDHGVSSAPGATVWAAIRPEKVHVGREKPASPDNWAMARRARHRLHGRPVRVPAAARLGQGRARHAAEHLPPRGRPHHLGRARLPELACLEPGRGDQVSEAGPIVLMGNARPPAQPRSDVGALAAPRDSEGQVAGHVGSVPVAAALLPDPVRDRAQDLVLGYADRDAAVPAALQLGGRPGAAGQASPVELRVPGRRTTCTGWPI